METKDNNEKNEKPQTPRERGVSENERANYSGFPPEDSKDEDFEENKDDIKETQKLKESETSGGDLAGNAAGSAPPEEEER